MRWHVAAVWAICSLLVLAFVVRHARRRLRLERLAGRKIIELIPYGRFGLRLQSWLVGGGGLLVIVLGVVYLGGAANEFEGRRDIYTAYEQSVVSCLFSAALIAGGITLIWWNRSIQLREHGVLRGMRIMLWTHVTERRWRENVLVVRGVDERQNDLEVLAFVERDKLEAVESLLAQNADAAYVPLLESQSDNDSAAIIPESSAVHALRVRLKRPEPNRNTALFPVYPRGSSPLRRLHVVFSVYAVIIGLLVFRPWEQQTRDFNVGAFLGCAAMALISLGEWWRSRPAGVPLIRLKPRLDWLSWCTALMVALTGCWINRLMGPVVLPVDWLLGAACGVSVFIATAMLVREKFDLYEAGIVHFRARILPWSMLRIVKWNPNGKGALVLRSGIWRLRAKVPTELRAAVDRVLREKLAERNGPAISISPTAAMLESNEK